MVDSILSIFPGKQKKVKKKDILLFAIICPIDIWQKLTSNFHTIKLRMHTRVEGSVTNALCDGNNIPFQSKPANFIYNAPPGKFYMSLHIQ
ncbi:unnamed protein product [Ranitomeya imitator]|uniref:Uncharacterized protein n=1 Tax=Ranitomeya imitator TaxID=111125 RepID=A0ABN9LZE8_9NEOB|nr:unnamed protein product [Ranitomeya imitator]